MKSSTSVLTDIGPKKLRKNEPAPQDQRFQLRKLLNQIRESEACRRLTFDEEERLRAEHYKQNAKCVKEATSDTYTSITEYTQTFNEHWVVEGRPTPYEPFPRYPYLEALFTILEAERIHWFEKSRDLMISWACVAYLSLKAMTLPECGVLFQTQKEKKAVQLVDYAKCLYSRQEKWLQDEFKLWKPIDQQADLELVFEHGGKIQGIPGGANQIRSYHSWGYLNDCHKASRTNLVPSKRPNPS